MSTGDSSSSSGGSSTTSGGGSGTASASGGADISAVTVNLKLPPFWPADPELWFAQVEAQFACRRITSQRSKFDYVVSSLTPEFAAEVRDLLIRPPADNPYRLLKEQMTKRTTASEQRKLQLLLHGEELGDRKPTQLLRKMQQLLGNRPSLDASFLKELFLQRLPPNVRMVLASTPDGTTLDQLAEMADKIVEVASPSMSALSKPSTESTTPTHVTEGLKQLQSEVVRLGKLVNKLTRNRSSSRGNHHPRRSPTPPSTDHPSESLCWYHSTYGEKAQKCRHPCTWSSNGQAGH
jgi:hypothetical protein